jgi:threo-3-hydroxy-L-aspartate ammonia-lyase
MSGTTGAAGAAEADSGLVSADRIRAAAGRLDGVAVRTPLIPLIQLGPSQLGSPQLGLSQLEPLQQGLPQLGQPLLIKPESLQPTGSFKLRGAYAAITAQEQAARQHGVVAHSSGNHGHAVAYAAARLGVRAVVVVPRTAPRVKTDAIEYYGAELVRVEPTLAARTAATSELVARHGYVLIPPFDDPEVIAGQGTVGLEIAADCPQVGLVLVPVSGGGLISGIAAAIRACCPDAAVVGVEPELAADARDSLRRGERVAWPSADVQRTVADALRVEQIGALPFAHMRALVAGIVTVTEAEMLAAVRLLARQARLVAEPGGAAAVAAWLYHRDELPAAASPAVAGTNGTNGTRPTVAVLSGGNIDPDLLATTLAAADQAG